MELIRGLKNGMVLQRDMGTNACKITISLRGVQHPQPSLGKLEHLGGERYRLTGIPVGGPYALTLADGTRRLEFADLWVGDVWLLGGQSNMERLQASARDCSSDSTSASRAASRRG